MSASKERIEEVKARLTAVGMNVLRMGLESIKRPMTEQELADLAKEMDEHILEHARLEERKKESAKAFKDAMDKEIEEARALAELRDKGYNDIDENCIIAFDPARNLICIIDPVTGIESATRMVTDKDLQTAMPLEPVAEKEKEPRAPEAIQIGFESGKGDQGPVEVEGVVIDDPLDMGDIMNESKDQVTQTFTDMVKSIKEIEGGFWIIETAEQTLYTDKKELHDIATKVGEAKMYAEFEFMTNDEARNKLLVGITPKEIEEPDEEIVMPDEVEDVSGDLDG